MSSRDQLSQKQWGFLRSIKVSKVYGARFRPHYCFIYGKPEVKHSFEFGEQHPFSPVRFVIQTPDGEEVLDHDPMVYSGSGRSESVRRSTYGWSGCGDIDFYSVVRDFLRKKDICGSDSAIAFLCRKLEDAVEQEKKTLSTEKETVELLTSLQKEWVEREKVYIEKRQKLLELEKQLHKLRSEVKSELDFLQHFSYVCPYEP